MKQKKSWSIFKQVGLLEYVLVWKGKPSFFKRLLIFMLLSGSSYIEITISKDE